MKTWFTSLNGAITLSVIALLTEVWRTLVDSLTEYPRFVPTLNAAALAALFFTVYLGGWAWTLVAAARGSRRGLIAALVLSVVIWLAIPVPTFPVYCPPGPCWEKVGAPFIIVNTLMVVVGLLAIIALALQLARKPALASR